jgi:uncharacterized Zn-binding protein involved in type VI secretion
MVNNMKNISNKLKKVFFAVLIISSFAFAGAVSADATITSVKLNGSNNSAAQGGAQITATVNVSLNGMSAWRSTAYKIGDGAWNCVDTPDHSGNTATETFLITAPAKMGTDAVNFEIYGNNNCTNGLDIASASASLLTAVTNIFSFGTGEIWLSALIIIILAFAVFYIVKIILKKNTNHGGADK